MQNVNAKRLLALITSVLYFDLIKHGNSDKDYFGIMCIFAPFLWIICAKLYNNEFTRFQSDISILLKGASINAIPATPRSLYHFQNVVVIISACIVFLCIVSSFWLINAAEKNSLISILIVQILFACVLFVNGIFTIQPSA